MPLFSKTQDQPISKQIAIFAAPQAPLTKDQKAFNSLIKKIDAGRSKLADWESAISLSQQKYLNDLHPLVNQEMELRSQLARALDRVFNQKGITKGEKKKLTAIITTLASEVLAAKEDEELKEIYNRHGATDYDVESAEDQEYLKSMLEGMLGMDLGDDVDMRSEADVLRRVEAQFFAQQAEHEAKKASRKKSRIDTAREARAEAEEKQLSQSIRDVYRKLASALHPDRETDPAEKARKTALMQRANEAYEKGKLLQLLELQLELEHIDQAHLANLKPERLKHYLKILKSQWAELEAELLRVEGDIVTRFGLDPFARLHPKDLMAMLLGQIADCQTDIRELQGNLEDVDDIKRLKAWLKTVTLEREQNDVWDMPF